MKKTFLFVSILLTSVFAYTQSYEGAVQYQNKLHPAAVIELPYSPSIVDAAMNDYLSKKGKSKSTDMKGFTTYRNTEPLMNDSTNADLYIKTERKSRKEKEVTMISLLVQPNTTETNTANLHFMDMASARTYLDNLAVAIGSYNLELTIKDQNDAVAKAESKYKGLMNEGGDLENKKIAIEKKIADNKNDLLQQQKEVENQKLKLTEWINQRKS